MAIEFGHEEDEAEAHSILCSLGDPRDGKIQFAPVQGDGT
jgi:hypothetical protein